MEKNPQEPEITAKQEQLRKYTYFAYNNREVPLFECTARTISEADILFKEAKGIDPTKRPDIGCSFEDVKKGI
jgi:hypothetical protein